MDKTKFKNITRKGKAKITLLSILCAVLLGCTGFGFASAFGADLTGLGGNATVAAADTVGNGYTFDATAPSLTFQKGGTQYNNAGASIGGTYATNEAAWNACIDYSVTSKKVAKFVLVENWTATAATINSVATTQFGDPAGKGIHTYGGLHIPAGAKIQFDLNGKTLDRALYRPSAEGAPTANLPLAESKSDVRNYGSVITMTGTTESRAQFELIDSTATAGYDVKDTGIFKKGTTTKATGMIRGGCGGSVNAEGAATDNYYGGGIRGESYCEIRITSGLIAYNKANKRGGAISASRFSNVYVAGGALAYNYSGSMGGGIYVSEKTFIPETTGGTIAYNYDAGSGGGIYLADGAQITLNLDVKRNASGTPVTSGDTGIQIYNNRAARGGGIYANNTDVIDLGTCVIKDNMAPTGGGITFVSGAGQMLVHDNPYVLGNTDVNGKANNLYFPNGSPKTKVTKALTKNTKPQIGMFMATAGEFTENFVTIMGSSAMASDYFTSDNATYTVNLEKGKEGSLILLNSYQAVWNAAVNTSIQNGGAQVEFNMDPSSAISGNWEASSGSFGTGVGFSNGALWVPAGANIKMNLKNRAINRKLTAGQEKGYVILVEGTLTITGTNPTLSATDGSITKAGGMITGGFGSDANATGVQVTGGTLNLQSGAIYGNQSSYTGTGGGGLSLSSKATFNMTGGFVSKNTAYAGSHDGGGIYGGAGNTMTMTAGEISWNETVGSSSAHGGGMIWGGTFNMQGGTIKKNRCSGSGGAIELAGTINMSGGSIIENTAACTGTASNRGLGGGIMLEGTAAKINISGTVNISKNTARTTGESNDLELEKGNTTVMTVTGTLNAASNIGVSLTDRTAYTSGLKTTGGVTTPSSVFFCNNPLYNATANASGELTFTQLNNYSDIWARAIDTSKNNGGAPVTFTLASLNKSWEATSGSFGTNTSYYENGALLVPSGANIIIELNGLKIDRKLTAATANGYVLAVRGTCTIQDSKKTTVNTSGALATATGAITGGWTNTANTPGGVLVAGTLNLNSGCIWGNKSSNANNRGGAGVYVPNGGTVNMTGGYISKNVGLEVESGGLDGGGVDLLGTMTMSGGEVSYNELNSTNSSNGAGVVVNTIATFTMTGGTIKNNKTASNYGGLYAAGGNVTLSGACNIYDNTTKSGGNDLRANVVIKIAGKVTSSKAIKTTTGVTGGVFTSGAGAAGMTITNIRAAFTNVDYATQIVGGKTVSGKLEAVIGTPVSLAAATGTITYNNKDQTLVTGFSTSAVTATLSYASGTASAVTAVTGKNAGSYKFVFTLKDGYIWDDSTLNYSADSTVTKTITVSIAKADLKDATLTITTDASTIIYKGSAWQPAYTATLLNLASSDYDVAWSNNTAAGTATLKITAKTASTNFTGTKSVDFTIKNAAITATPGNVSKTYTGTEYVIAKTGTTVTSAQTLVAVSATTVGSQTYTYKFSTTITNGASGNWTNADTTYKITNVNATATTVYYQITAPNHDAKYGSFTVKVNNATITASPSNVSKTYTGTEYVVAKTGTTVTSVQTLVAVSATTVNSQAYTYKFSTTDLGTTDSAWSSAATSYKITNVNATATTVYYQITAANHTTKYGSFTVKVNNATITGTVANQTWTYDGTTHQIMNAAGTVTAGNTKNGISLTVVNSQTQTWKFSTTNVSDWSTVTANNSLTFKDVADTNGTTGVTVYYQVTAPNHAAKTSSFTVSIGKATLTDASTAYNKPYDGAAHSITVSATGFKGSDTWANAAGKTITYGLTNGTYDETDNPEATYVSESTTVYYKVTFDNYNDITGYKALTITQKAITAIELADVDVVNDRDYDGKTAGTLVAANTEFTSDQIVGSDEVYITAATNINFNDKNVGTGKEVKISGISIGGAEAGNYSIAGTVEGKTKASISAIEITAITGITVNQKTYDGTTAATLNKKSSTDSNVKFVGMVTGDELSIDSATTLDFDDKNAGTGKPVTVKGITLGGTDKDNYYVDEELCAYASGTTRATATINKKGITAVTGIEVEDKVYDGTTAATLSVYSSADGVVFTGMVDGDELEIDSATTLEFANKNVGTGKNVTVKGITLGGTDKDNYSIGSGINAYASGTVKATAEITKLEITSELKFADNLVKDKVYDANRDGELVSTTRTDFTCDDIISGDEVYVTAASSILFEDKDIGTNKIVTISGVTLGGTDAGNYSIDPAISGDTKASITGKALTAASTAANKTYDSNTDATITLGTVTGLDSSDDVTITPTGTFDNKNVGTGKTVTITYALTGDDAGNYSMASITVTADITAKAITADSSADDKTYDGGTTATVTLGTVTGVEDGDDLTITPTGTFADKNVGTGKNVNITYALTGTDAGNYSMADITVNADIEAKVISAIGLATMGVVDNKTYDGTTDGTLKNDATTGTAFTSDDLVSGDTVFIASASSIAFDDANVDTGITVTVSGITLGGTDKDNYSIESTVEGTTTANITAKAITVITLDGGLANNKTYDGTKTGTLASSTTAFTSTDVVDGDEVYIASASSIVFDDANVDTGITVTVSGITLGGDQSGNYTIASTVEGTTTADIEAYDISTDGASVGDGSDIATIGDVTYTGAAQTKKPVVEVKLTSAGNTTLVEDTDYEVYYNNEDVGGDDTTSAGKIEITINGLGNYSGSRTVYYTINKATISAVEWNSTTGTISFVYDGDEHKPVLTKVTTSTTIVAGIIPADLSTMFNYEYHDSDSNTSDCTEQGSYTAVASLNDTYAVNFVFDSGIAGDSDTDTEKAFSITSAAMTLTVTPYKNGTSNYVYDGQEHDAFTSVKATLKSGDEDSNNVVWYYAISSTASKWQDIPDGDWDTDMPQVMDAKTYRVFYKVTADNHATNGGLQSVTIGKKTISGTYSASTGAGSVVTKPDAVTYTGSAITEAEITGLEISVKLVASSEDMYTLTNTDDVTEYTLTLSNNTNAGNATITITGAGNFQGTRTATFTIDKADITDVDAVGYTGTFDNAAHNAIEDGYTATWVNETANPATWSFSLDKSTWSTTMLPIKDATEGTKVYYKIEASNHNTYNGEVTVVIDKMTLDLDDGTRLNEGNALADMKYTGSALEPAFKVEQEFTSGTYTLLDGTDDYDVTYADNTNVGTATATVTGKGNYTGSVEITFSIIPDDGMTASANAYGGATGATYDGAYHEAVTGQTASATGGNAGNNVKWWYSLEDLDTDSTDGWSEDVPELRDATAATGTTVYWMVTADNNAPVSGSVTVIIKPKQITAVSGIAADGKVYDGLNYYLSGDNGSVQSDGSAAGVQLDNAINSQLTGYIATVEDYDGENKTTRDGDLSIVWADSVTDAQKGTFSGVNKGTQTVTVPSGSLALSGADAANYELALSADIVISDVEISARVVELTWTGLEQNWADNKELKPTATVSNLVGTDNITTILTITQNGVVVASKAPGDYHVEVTGLNGNTLGNYTITGANDLEKTFTITTAGLIVNWNTDGILYDGSAKLPDIYYEKTVDGVKTQVDLINGEESWLQDGTSLVIKDSTGKEVEEAINAGTYTVTLTLDVNHIWSDDLNGLQKEKTITFTIGKATVEGVKLEGDTVTYDGDAHKLIVDWSAATLNGEAITDMPDGVTATVYYDGVASNGVTNAGTYKVTVKFTVNGNFEDIASIEDVELTIDKAEIALTDIVFDDKTEVYSGSAYTVEIAGTVDEKVSVSYAYTQDGTNLGSNGVTAVGEYTVTATFAFKNAADKDNYFITVNGNETTTLTATLTINKEAASVTDVVFEDSLNEVYDGNIHRLLVSGAATGVKSVSYEYATDNSFTNIVSTDGVKDAGTYYVRATFTVDGNYAPVEPMVKQLVIAKAELTVTANDKTITYGDNPATAELTATYTGLVGTDTESSIGATLAINGYTLYGDVDIYEGVVKVTGPTSTTNYTITYNNGDLTVKPYEVTVKWYNTGSKTSQDLTYTYDGTVKQPYAEVSNAIPGRPVTVNVEGGKSAVGMNYEATATSLSNSNYALPESGLTVTFDILPATPKSGKIIWDYTTLYYNGKEQAPKAYYFENENDNVPKELKVTVNKTAINAGNYVASVVLDGSLTLTGDPQLNFKIEKRIVHVVIDDYEAAYTGTVDFSGATWSYASGSLEFVSTDSYAINFSAEGIDGPGTYALNATFSCANGANYDVQFSGSWSKAGDTENNGKWGTLTVTAAKYDMSKVTFTGSVVTYDGNAHVLNVSGLPAGVTVSSVSYLLDGWNLGSDGATAVGVYNVIVKFSGSEYFEAIADIETTLTIKKAALTVKANDNTIVYGDAASYNGVVYTINGTNYDANDAKLAGELTGTLTLSLEDGYAGNAGKYKIIPAGLTAANYEITFVPGTLTVSPREITVTWYSDNSASSTNLNYDYDNSKHTPYPVANGLLGEDKITFTVGGGQTEAGLNYTATITAVSNGNYTVSAATSSVKFSIVQKGVIIWDNTPLYYEKGVEKIPTACYYDEDEGRLIDLDVTVDKTAIEAGKYTATVISVLPAYISDANIELEYEILPQEITITIGNAADLVYGNVEGTANLEKVLADLLASMGLDDIVITLECDVNNGSAVGAYAITGKYDGKNYKVTFVNGSLNIVKADVVDNGTLAAFDGKTETVTYDGKAHTVEVSGTLPAGVTGVAYKYYNQSGAEITANDVVNAGTYTIEAIFTVDGNHNAVTDTYAATLTIEQAELTVKFDKESYTFDYDGKLHSAKVTGDLTGIKSVKYLYDGVELTGVKNAGTYTVTVQIEVEDAANYKAVTLGSVTLTINKIELTVTANNGSIVYGETADANGYGYTVSGLPANDAGELETILGTVAYSYETVTGAGVYDISISGNTSSTNYSNINYVDGKLTVTPYTLTASDIQWTDKQDGVPATDGKFVYTQIAGTVQQPYAVATGVGGETVTLVVEGGQINAGYGYQAQIVGISGTNAKNYQLPAEGLNITFDILPAPVTGTIIWDNSPLYYDGTNLKPKAYYFLEEGGDRLELPVTVEGDSKNAGGKYVATVDLSGISAELSGDKSKEFTVVARPVYVEIGNLDVQFGDTPNMGAVSWKYVHEDDATKQFLAGEKFSITFSCGTVSEVGTYPISAQFISSNAGNYEVIFTGSWVSAGADNGKYGTLTIFKASYDMSKVTLVGTSVTYDGKLHTVSVIGLPEGVSVASVTYEKDGFGYDANGVKNVGVYTVTVKFSGDANYGDIEDLTATLTVNKAALTIKANDNTVIYGEQPSANGVTYSGFAEGEEEANDLKGVLSYTYSYVSGDNVGKYDIVPTGFTSENYEITYKIGTLTVAPRTITVTWYDDETLSSQTFNYDYDEQTHAPYAVAGNLVNGDSLTLTVTGSTDLPGLNFTASVGELTNANYKLPNDETVNQAFSIMPAPVGSIVWDSQPLYYNGTNLKPKAYYVEEDGSWREITDVRVAVGGVTVSTYINAGLYTATAVYDGGRTSSQTYNILPLAVSIEIQTNAEIVYGTTPDMSAITWEYADGSNTFIASDLVGGAPVSFICPTANAQSTVGKYDILGSCTNTNYSVTFVNGTLNIIKASYDMSGVVYGDLTATYDGGYHTVSISNLPEGITATVSYEKDGKVYGPEGVSDVGEYNVTVTFTVLDTVNYNSVSGVELTLTIDKQAANVDGIIFHNHTNTVIYNGKVQEMYVSGTATGVAGVIYTYYAEDRVTEIVGGAINAGTYKVKAEFTFDPNYSGDGIDAMWATLVIKQAALTVTAHDGSVVYGETADANGYGYTVTGLVGGDSEEDILGALTFKYGTYSDAQVYANAIEIEASKTPANYDVTYVYGTLTVTPREITVTWYDEENGTEGTVFEYLYEDGKDYIPYAEAGNLVGSDVLVLDVQVSKSSAGDNYVATVQPLTGNYTLPASGITVNFTIKYKDEELEQHKYELVWDNSAMYYDKDAKVPTARYYDGTDWQYIDADDLVIKNKSGEVVEAIDVGEYTAEYVPTINDATVTFKNLTFNFEVSPRKVYITIGDMQVKFGETPDMNKVSWTYADGSDKFIAGDVYTLTFSVEEITSAKKYPITGTFGGNANYEVIFTGASWATSGADNGAYGTLTVSKATYDMSRVTFSGTDVTYDGTAHEITVNSLPEGVTSSVSYTRSGWTYNNGVTNAGTYTVTISFTGDDNHEAIADMTATLTVKKAALTVTANDSAIVYGDAPKASGVTYEGLAASDTDESGAPKASVFSTGITYEYNYLKGGKVGEYNITPKGLTADNYVITYAAGTLTVNKRIVTVTWYSNARMDSQSLSYNVDGNEHLPYAEAGNVLAGDSVVLTVDPSCAQSQAGINYLAKVVAISNSNYALPENATVYFEIIPDAYVVVWESTPFVYNGEAQTPKAYYYTVNGERVSLRVTVLEGDAINAGITYHATASLVSGSVELKGELTREFSIAKREVTVIINESTSKYGEDIVLKGWKYAEGSLHFVGEEPFYISPLVTSTSPVGNYVLTGVCTDERNYNVTVINAKYTVTKATVTAPEIASKVYNGELQKADIESNDIFTVIYNREEKEAGTYTVILQISYEAYSNYKWADTNNQQYYVEFVITKAPNEWTTEFEVRGSVVAGSGEMFITEPVAKYGNKEDIVIKYYTDESCEDRYEKPLDYIVTEAPSGTYYAVVSLAGGDNYEAISTPYAFSVTGTLALSIVWTNTTLTYNGKTQAPEAYVWIEGEQVMLIVTGGQKDAGTYEAHTDLKAVDGRDLSGYDIPNSAKATTCEYKINPRSITVSIDDDASSVYGSQVIDLSRLNWTRTQGSVMSGDELGITFRCEVTDVEFAAAGVYPIIGECANGNYDVTFVGSWSGDDEYKGSAATYTVRKAAITLDANESTWIFEGNQTYVVSIDEHVTTKGNQKATVYYSTRIDEYDPAKHDGITDIEIAQRLPDGGSTSAPEIAKEGDFVIYYRIEAENHEVKYGIWKVLIRSKDRYIIVNFTGTYEATYGDANGEDILDALIANNSIEVSGRIDSLETLRKIAKAYAYEDVSSENGFVNSETPVGKYSIRFVFDEDAADRDNYRNIEFRYSTSNSAPDTNTDKYVIVPRPITLNWTGTKVTYDGNTHLPSVKLMNLVGVGDAGLEIGELQLGENLITIGDETFKVIVTRTMGSDDLLTTAGQYQLRLTIKNENYEITDGTDLVIFIIERKEVSVTWDTTSFEYDGNRHIPEATVTIGDEVITLKEIGIDVPIPVTLASGEVVNITFSLVGTSDMATGDYELTVSIDGKNYKLNADSQKVKVSISGYEEPFKLVLPEWGIYAIAGSGLFLLLLIIILSVVLKKRKPAGTFVDEDGFSDIAGEDD